MIDGVGSRSHALKPDERMGWDGRGVKRKRNNGDGRMVAQGTSSSHDWTDGVIWPGTLS